jgi:hypothetical protein
MTEKVNDHKIAIWECFCQKRNIFLTQYVIPATVPVLCLLHHPPAVLWASPRVESVAMRVSDSRHPRQCPPAHTIKASSEPFVAYDRRPAAATTSVPRPGLKTCGNRYENRGNRSYRSGPVPVPVGSQPVQIQILNLNSKK